MKKILVAFLFFIVAAAAGAQDAAQPAPKQAPASSQTPSSRDSATDDAHAGGRDFRMDGTPPERMFFAQWEFILSKGSAADRKWVWDAIKGKTVQMRGTVITATANQIDLAEAHNIDPRKADVALSFQGPISVNAFPKQDVNFIPKEGASFDFQGVVSSYTRKPFMLIMEKGMLFLPVVAPTSAEADDAASH